MASLKRKIRNILIIIMAMILMLTSLPVSGPEVFAADTDDEESNVEVVSDEDETIIEEVPAGTTVAAVGEIAVLVQMLGGDGVLVATSDSFKTEMVSGISAAEIFADELADDLLYLGDIEGFSEMSTDMFDALVEAAPDVIFMTTDDYSDWTIYYGKLSSARRQAFTEAEIEIVKVMDLDEGTSSSDAGESLLYDVELIGKTLGDRTEYGGQDAEELAEDYEDWYDGIMGSLSSSGSLYSCYISSWDDDVEAKIKSSYVTFTETGMAIAKIGLYLASSFYMNAGGVTATNSQTKNAATKTTKLYYVMTLKSSALGFSVSGGLSSSVKMIEQSLSGMSNNDCLLTEAFDVGYLGSENYPALLVASEDIKEKIESSRESGGLFSSSLTREYFELDTAVETTTIENDDYDVYVVPYGVGNWAEGSAESPLFSAWIAYKFYGTFSEDDIIILMQAFYTRFYRYSLSSSEAKTILAGRTDEDSDTEDDHEHDWVESGSVEATSTKAGYIEYTCSVCGETYQDVIAATGSHSYTVTSEITVTCTEDAVITFTCVNCGYSFSVIKEKATGHSFSSYVSNGDATCEADGTKTAICDNGCGTTDTVTDKGSATGHSWTLVTTSVGNHGSTKETYTCSQCGEEKTVTSLYGSDRYETAEDIAANTFESCTYAVVADGSNFPDALAAASLAGALDAPILITSDSKIQNTIKELKELGVTNVYIVGGTSSVSAGAQSAIEEEDIEVERISGSTRQTTAVAVAEKVLSITGGQDVCLVATGSTYADALAASPYAYWSSSPIYLTNNDGSISDKVLASIEKAGYSRIVIIGGIASVTEETEEILSKIADITRLGGSTRYETAAIIAAWSVEQGMSYNGLAIATGTNYPDALTASALCGKNGSVLLLSAATLERSTVLEAAITENADGISDIYIVGGYSSVSEEIREMITDALG